MQIYDDYNREERALCAHLFRLLHEWITPGSDPTFITRFLEQSGLDVRQQDLGVIKIYTEVALIRDAYFHRKLNAEPFMDDLAREIICQDHLSQVRIYSELPDILKDPSRTHPGQIRQQAKRHSINLSSDERRLYGAVQGMFNAKPDLAITTADSLIVYEAKFTQGFDGVQLKRTKHISKVWSKLLCGDLGFEGPPKTIVSKLGARVFDPEVSWEWIFDLVKQTYPPNDRTYIAIRSAVSYLSELFTA